MEETLPSGVRFNLTYDHKGRLIRKKSSDGSIDYSFKYTYHDCVAEAKDKLMHSSTRRTYDGFKHILTETQSNGLALSYTYNQEGLLESVLLPDNSKVTYTFHGGLLEKATRTSPQTTYNFSVTKRNSAGMILETSLPLNGGTVQYSYDNMGHVLSKKQQKAFETRSYDLIGRVESHSIDGVIEQYRYDFLSQIISDNGRVRAYDSLYRLREKEGDVAQVTRRQQITQLGVKKFLYDLDGRRTNDCGAVLRYDALGRLISYEKDGQSDSYEYDAFSRRMKKNSGATVERYLWLGQQDIGTYDESNHALTFRLLAEGVGKEGGATIAVELNGTPYVAFSDLSGNIRSLVSESGDEVHTASYSSFARIGTTGLECPWGYFSKRHDALSSYVMFLYRLYDPVTSTWITQDPLGLEGGPNLYAYVKNNPLSLFDMLGLFDCGSFYDSCCSFVSDCCRSVCDAVSSACSSVCDSVGSACSAAYDYCSSCASSVGSVLSGCASWVSSAFGGVGSAASSCSSFVSPPKPSSYTWKNGKVIDANTKLKGGVYVYPIGTYKDFLREAAFHPSMWGKLSKVLHFNGMNTSPLECCQRIDPLLGTKGGIEYVAFAYNPKDSFAVGAGKAASNAVGIETKEMQAIRDQLMEFLDAAEAEGISGFSPHCHSQGAAILDCILHTKEFNPLDNTSYFRCFGQIHTYGAATFIKEALNHVAYFDIVPFLNPRNWATMICNPDCVQFTAFEIQSPLRAHGFDNPSYQSAYQPVLDSQ